MVYVDQLARQIRGLGTGKLNPPTGKMFGKPLASLTGLDASSLIDTLKTCKDGSVSLEAALNGVSPECGVSRRTEKKARKSRATRPGLEPMSVSPEKTGVQREGAAQSEVNPPDAAGVIRWLDAHNVVLCEGCRTAILELSSSGSPGESIAVD